MTDKEAIQKRIIVDLYTELKTLKKNDTLDEFFEDIPLKRTTITKSKEDILKNLKLIQIVCPSTSLPIITRKEKYVSGIITASLLCQLFGIDYRNFGSFQKEMVDGGINVDFDEETLFQINQYYFIFKNAWDIKATHEHDGLIDTILLNPLKKKINEMLQCITIKPSTRKRSNPFHINFRFSFQSAKKPKVIE